MQAEVEAGDLHSHLEEARERCGSLERSLEEREQLFEETVTAERSARAQAEEHVRQEREDDWAGMQADLNHVRVTPAPPGTMLVEPSLDHKSVPIAMRADTIG